MAEKGCLYGIAVIMGLAVWTEAGWTFGSNLPGAALGIGTTVGIAWYLSTANKPKD